MQRYSSVSFHEDSEKSNTYAYEVVPQELAQALGKAAEISESEDAAVLTRDDDGNLTACASVEEALNIAAERAHLDIKDCYIVKYPEEKSLWEQIMDAYYDRDEEKEIRARLDAIIPFYSDLEAWSKMEPLQARLPFILKL